jgi:hypothetical protein
VTPLNLEAFRRGITPPAPSTLARYGLSAEEWLGLLAEQGWKCPICLKDAADIKLNTDHEHARGWGKMRPEMKKQYTRGILCSYCNYRRVHSTNTGEICQRISDYVFAYEKRKGVSE